MESGEVRVKKAEEDRDLNIACAVSAGQQIRTVYNFPAVFLPEGEECHIRSGIYDPLTNDVQAMALVKSFSLHVYNGTRKNTVRVAGPDGDFIDEPKTDKNSVNRAIVKYMATRKPGFCEQYKDK